MLEPLISHVHLPPEGVATASYSVVVVLHGNSGGLSPTDTIGTTTATAEATDAV